MGTRKEEVRGILRHLRGSFSAARTSLFRLRQLQPAEERFWQVSGRSHPQQISGVPTERMHHLLSSRGQDPSLCPFIFLKLLNF